MVAGIAALAIGLYGLIGDTRRIEPRTSPDITQLVARMKTRLEAVPNDSQTRALLAQVQMARRNYAAAAQTLAAINAQLPSPDTMFLLAEARARVLSHDGMVTERAQALYEQVLTIVPNNPEALWFAGLAQLSDGNRAQAKAHWQRLLKQDIREAFRTRVERRLAELRGATPSLGTAD